MRTTEGVSILLGDPRSHCRLNPVIVALSVQTVYNLTDTFWVAGLGADALAAVDFLSFFPCPDGGYQWIGGEADLQFPGGSEPEIKRVWIMLPCIPS